MNGMTKLGIGVLGLQEGRTLLKALNHPIPATVGETTEKTYRAPHVRAVAGCDLDPEKINKALADCPDLFYTTDYDAMLKRDDVDIVAIYTPDQFHNQHIIKAFEAGKHVICTKPLVNTIDDARKLYRASQHTDRKLLVGQSVRFFEPFRRQRNAYEASKVGQIELVDAHYVHRMDWYYQKSPWAANATDWVFLGLSHAIDLVCWYLGNIDEVFAMGTYSALAHHYKVRSPDILTVSLRSSSGQIGRAMGNYGLRELPSARNAIELMLYGSAGTSLAQYHDMCFLYTQADGTEVKEDMLYHQRGYYFNNEVHGMHFGEFANYAEYFASALLGNAPYSPNLNDGLAIFAVMESARRSMATGQPVTVATIMAEITAA